MTLEITNLLIVVC